MWPLRSIFVVVVPVVLAIALVGCSRTDEPAAVQLGPTAEPTETAIAEPATTEPEGTPSQATQLRSLAPAPFELPGWLDSRGGHSVSWTGSELLVWGGWSSESAGVSYANGGAYSPESDSWRPLAPGPLSPRAHHAAVWTGEQLLVVGGQTQPGEVVDDGAAYNPTTDSWNKILSTGETHEPASPPLVEAVWTGQQLVMWYRGQGIVRSYDPTQDAWSVLPDVDLPRAETLGALRWTGAELVALAGDGPGAMRAATMRPNVDTDWLELPAVSFKRPGFSGDPFRQILQSPTGNSLCGLEADATLRPLCWT